MKIGLDMMGGDFAPLEAVKGVAEFLSTFTADLHLVLIGDEEQIKKHITDHPIPADKYSIVHASQVIGMHEHPTKALREKKESSIAIGFHLLATGKTDAFVSAGNTGAMMVGALFSIKAIEGVLRPTIGAYLPREDGTLGLLVDVGLNADCKPENLNQFAILGSLFAQHILNFENPKVGLVNLGEEEGKGNILAQATYPLLNFEQYGGVPVLGVAKPVIIGHGISHAVAFKNMIRIAYKMLEIDLMGKIKNSFVGQA